MKKSLKGLITASQLRLFTPELFPETLKTPIHLPHLSGIQIQHRKGARQLNQLIVFLKRYGPSIRYYNPNMRIVRRVGQEFPAVPVIRVFGNKNQEEVVVQQLKSSSYKTAEQLLQKIVQLSKSKAQAVERE